MGRYYLAEERMTPTEDFSLMHGGPVYHLWRRTQLADDSLELLQRRIGVTLSIAWLPLLVLALVGGHAWGTEGVSFLRDAETQVRLLVALPLLIYAEVFVHRRMRAVVSQFVVRGMVKDSDRPQFDAAVASAMRLRNSTFAEVLILLVVYVIGIGFVWRNYAVTGVGAWYGTISNGSPALTAAGLWLCLVSLPLFQFILLRWYYRLLIWARLLWEISRIDLQYLPTHPDRCGGIGFIGSATYAYTPLLLAQGAMLAGLISNRVLYSGATLANFKLELFGLVVVMLLGVLGPLLPFCPKLAAAKRDGAGDYGRLVNDYAREFDRKWLRGGTPVGDRMLGHADIQSLADLGSTYGCIREMRWLPFSAQMVFQLAVTTLLPVAPLLLTMFPLEELLDRLLRIAF